MKTWNASVIGCGRIGSAFSATPHTGVLSHAEAYATCGLTRLAAVCDTDATAVRAAADRWGLLEAWTDIDAMLDRVRPEIVSVCVPDAAHGAVGLRVVRHPAVRALVMEKPLALAVDEARELAEAAAARGVVLAVNYSRRFAPGIRRAAAALHSGAFGEIQCVTGHYTNGLWHNGSHWLDLLAWFFPAPEVVGTANPLDETGDDPTLEVRLRLANGAPVTLHACQESCYSRFDMDISGTGGRLLLSDFGNRLEHWTPVADPVYQGFWTLALRESWDGGMELALGVLARDMIAHLEHGAPLKSSAATALSTLELCQAGFRNQSRS